MSTYVPDSLHLMDVTRYEKPFEVLGGYLAHNFLTSPSGSAFLEGTVVSFDSSQRAVVAASGAGDGFAIQTVADLSTLKGRRNLNQTVVNKGDAIGVAYGNGLAATKIHEGSGNIGDLCWWDGTTLRFDTSGSVPSGVKILGRLLQRDGSNPTLGVNGTAGSTTAASTHKAIVMFDFPIGASGDYES